MTVGVAREAKAAERRVALTPGGVKELTRDGHQVLVEEAAGRGSGFSDDDYVRSGARIVDHEEVWADSELLVKVKEPIEAEYRLLHPGLSLFAYLHLAPNPSLVEALVRSDVTALAYETVEVGGELPLLTPMSEIAGPLAIHAAAHFLQTPYGGSGTLIGGASGVAAAHVVVLGGGHAGFEAARVAVGVGAEVTILELASERIRVLEHFFDGRVRVLMSDTAMIEEMVSRADVVVGTVLVSGSRAPRLVTHEILEAMEPGSVLIDVAIDQGGCAESSHATTHEDPTYVVDDVVHYCVTNMPGAVPSTSTRALTNATLPYIRKLAALGIDGAILSDPSLALGVNVRGGEIVHDRVREAYGHELDERTAVTS